MADDCGERHIRLVYFLANGCTKLVRKLVEKLVELSKPSDHKPVQKPWSLDNFLNKNMTKLLSKSVNEKMKDKLFPGFQKEASMKEWDLNILCHVVMSCTNNQYVTQDIKQLKNLRNEMYHIGNTDIEKERFERQVEVIEIVVKRCCAFIHKPEFTQEMETFLCAFKKGQIVRNDEDLEKIRHWYENDPMSQLLSKVDGLSDDHQTLLIHMKEMMNMLKLMGLKGVVLPETNVEIIIKNCNKDKEGVISEHLVNLLKSKLDTDIPETDKRKILEAVKDAMGELLAGGREITDMYVACVNMQIKCPTFENMQDLWVDCMTGKMTTVFKTVEKYVKELTGCPDIVLEVGITHFEFYRVFEATVMAVAKALRSEGMDTNTNQEEIFKEITEATLAEEDGSLPLHQQTGEEGTRVVMRVQPATFNQVENMWEACQSGSFNRKLEKLTEAFKQVYGFEDLRITAKLEGESPYQDVFRKKVKKADYPLDKVPMVEGIKDAEKVEKQKPSIVDSSASIESKTHSLLEIYQDFETNIRKLENQYTNLDNTIRDKDETESMLKSLDTVLSLGKELNADMKEKRKSLVGNVDRFVEDIQSMEKKISSQKQELQRLLENIKCYIESLMPDLKEEVRKNQREIANKYIELTSSEILDCLASWCSDVGYVIYELKEKVLIRWKQIEAGCITTSAMSMDVFAATQKYLEDVFQDLMKSTFIVTDQSDYCVRLEKKQLPKITVRFLSLDKIDFRAIKVTAAFLNESNNVFMERELCNGIQAQYQLKYAEKAFNRIQARERFEVTFDKMDFAPGDFDRLGEEHSQSSYFKQFYRFIFFTTIERQTYWAMSLPVVVTSAASQSCGALAAVMWNCFDVDVFSLPLQKRNELPWTHVAKMLNTKFMRLCTTRALTDESLSHLKTRLLGNTELPDSTMVSLSRFCHEPLANCKFPFWKWFLGNYNLVETDLKPYWQDGLIAGFVSRTEVETKFKNESKIKSGTFVLRFSDNNITDSVGARSVCGFLTAIVALKVETKDGIMTRYEAIEVADHKKLRSTSLANILRESLDRKRAHNIYKYLFPGYRKREECFDVHCSEERSLNGYIGRQDAFLIDLEQEIAAVTISMQRQNSRSSDSADSGMSLSPSDLRSLSPAHNDATGNSSLGIYHHSDFQVDLSSPEDISPSLDSLFSLSKVKAENESEACSGESEVVKEEFINDLVRKLTGLARDSPEKFSQIMHFILSQISKNVFDIVNEQF